MHAKQLGDLFEQREVSGKQVYVVDEHHKAMAPWALLRRQRERPPVLITLDHHTDTLEAFLRAAAVQERYDFVKREAIRAGLVAKLTWDDDAALLTAIGALQHDEHIDASIRCGIIEAAFCIQLSDSFGSPRPDELLRDHIFIVPHECYIGCERLPHNDDCEVRRASQILESVYLEDQLARASEMSCRIGLEHPDSVPYILDIDLDVFHTRQSIEPSDPSTFYRLIRGAIAITIATEEECVDELWLDQEGKLSSAALLARTLEHIQRALG